jgi:rubrerythrin
MDAPKAGQRLQCQQCGTEVVVIKPPEQVPECCGHSMTDPSRKG